MQTVDIKQEIQRIGYISAGTINFSKNKKMAARFIDFLLSEGKQIFKKHYYLVSEKEAFKYLSKELPVGGDYKIPNDWIIE